MEKINWISKASISSCEKDYICMNDLPLKSSTDNVDPQQDLMKMISVLVSTGINKNDDVFLKEELLPARSTGALKPVNLEHDEEKIIGTMVRTFVTSKAGTEINDDEIDKNSNIVPKDFDITNEAVIYSFLFPDIAKEIKSKALNNKLFVSVEAWFKSYDFLVGNKIVARNEDTAPILDPVLRINGGDGIFQEQRTGRVLREILIGGIGIVEKPANPESVIKSIGTIAHCDVDINDNVILNNIIGDAYKIVANKTEIEGEEEMKEVLNEMKEMLKATQDKLTEQEKQNEQLKNENIEFKNKEISSARAAELSDEIGLSDELIQEELERVVAMSKEEFQAYKEFLVKILNNKGNKQAVIEEEIEAINEKEDGLKDDNSDVTEPIDEVIVAESNDEVNEDKEEGSNDTQDIEKLNLDAINKIDPELNVETDELSTDLVGQFGNVVTKFLEKSNPKWNKMKE